MSAVSSGSRRLETRPPPASVAVTGEFPLGDPQPDSLFARPRNDVTGLKEAAA